MEPIQPLLTGRSGECRVAFCGREPGTAEGLPTGLELAWNRQVHGTRVVAALAAGLQDEADGLWTSRRRLALVVQTADCVPVVLVGNGRVAAVHAGWRGLASGVVEHALTLLGPIHQVWIGPAIGPCCYEVGPEVAERFDREASSVLRPGRGDRFFLDLTAAVGLRLPRGVPVEVVNACTRCDQRWWSYRRSRSVGEGGAGGRNLTLAWLEGET